jgi:hypothetical protein
MVKHLNHHPRQICSAGKTAINIAKPTYKSLYRKYKHVKLTSNMVSKYMHNFASLRRQY